MPTLIPASGVSQATVDSSIASNNTTQAGYYRTVQAWGSRARTLDVAGAGTYLLQANGAYQLATATSPIPSALYLDSTRWARTGLSTKLQLCVACAVNDAAPVASFVFGLYPIGTPSGAVNVWNPNLGTVVSGSTVTFTTPAANSKSTESVSGDFAFPATGWYHVAVAIDAGFAASSVVDFPIRLDVRSV